ncbi:unnamed protein product [Durusdinium trenchii]|uniref:Uncharacterized protein n=1 Tax=Durusdinium trenchii TaxID=1381693 RepID=A0ABP0MMS2_9DINO
MILADCSGSGSGVLICALSGPAKSLGIEGSSAMCWPDLAKPAVIRRKIFQAQDLRSEDQTVFKSRAAQDTLVLLCEGFGLMTLVELHLDPAKYSVKDGPSRPLVRDELFGPHLLAVGDWSDCRHPVPAGAPLYFEPMERGWQAPTWRLTEDSWVAVIGIGVPMTALRRGAYKCLLRYSFWVMLRT